MKNHDVKREQLLQAAAEIIFQSGVNGMTLEAVARRANVSKGGLLYHFPNKDALIEAMNRRLEQQFETAIDAEIERELAEGEAPVAGRWLRAYVRVSTTAGNELDALSSALMAAVSTNPSLLNSMREADARWQTLAENDGIEPHLATAIRLAADGCWLAGLFGLNAGFNSEVQLRELQATLLRLIEQGVKA